MKLHKKDVKIDLIRGQGPGGQNRNRRATCVRATHVPTGVCVTIDGRNQGQNKRRALRILADRLAEMDADAKAGQKKAKRDAAIQPQAPIRTYDHTRGLVTDHRTKKTATIKQVLGKGRIDLLQPDPGTAAAATVSQQ